MTNETINPIHHSTLGKATATVGGTVGGAVGGAGRSVAKTMMYSILGTSALFVVIGLTGGAGALFGGGLISTMIGNAIGGSLVGVVIGGVASMVTGGIGAWVGAAKGGSQALERVRNEQGAANMLDAQLSAYQSQALASQQATTIYAPSAANNNSFPAQGSTMNQAGARIQADTAQNLGTINGMQLQRA